MNLPLPRKLENAGARDVHELAEHSFKFSNDVVEYLRLLEQENTELAARVAELEAGGVGWALADGLFHWNPDVEPATPGSDSLWFPGASWTGFTEWDPSTSQTWDVDTTKRMGRVVQTGNGALRWGGMYRAIPDSEFVVYTQLNSIVTSAAGGSAAGLLVAADIAGSPGTANFFTNDITYASGAPQTTVRAREWTQFDGATVSSTNAGDRPHPTHFRCRVDGTDVMSDYSHNGITWIHYDTTTVTFTPAYFGVAMVQVDNTVQGTALFRYLQTYSGAGTSGINATAIGRAMTLPIYP